MRDRDDRRDDMGRMPDMDDRRMEMNNASMSRMEQQNTMGGTDRMSGRNKEQKLRVAERVYLTVDEHMAKGISFHEQLADYFCFLGLHGYKEMLESQYMEECAEKRKLHHRYIDTHQKILPVIQVQTPVFIPRDWSRYTMDDIDDSVVPKFVRSALKEWKQWEEKTKDLYEDQYDVLSRANLVSDCEYIKTLIIDVENEIKKVSRITESLNGTGYDVNMIHGMQDKYMDTYRKRGAEPIKSRIEPYYDEYDRTYRERRYDEKYPVRRRTIGF